ncbi:ADP-ribosylglycohydrolase [Rhizodiscina lignyota]|uniref:ADP-ribosylhydrolase ARH3 n=1 Tax=Rhizodiscina lignyota TaxID=1504668 RepID=A0A9P4M350_9PEZI|nr:ADP-ribosylglycohydrolase [Rhizodiscina lignyota]
MPDLPSDYLERVYAGVLGKLIGVYLGRPFEGWTHQRILKELGHIEYYVHEKLDVPLVVTDDDVSGTFVFPRALLEHGVSADITSENIGDTWLNNVVEGRSIFWWGGNGISTEHTAFLNLKKGIRAPGSGSIETNGKTVAEQIGAQIFIDGWGMVAPGNPELAAKLAERAGKVSHDGESVYAAMLLAAMEAEAFVSKNVDHLLDTGLSFIPRESQLAKMIAEIREWCRDDKDWLKTRERIEEKYGYHKYCGNCHVMPNHGIMVLSLVYGGDSFHEAMHIINTCGWDTDCNSGNIACLVALMHGMNAFEGGPDWRGPLADRALISSADGGYSINNAVRIAYDIVNMGRQLAHEKPLDAPKQGAQFHFSLPGSVQGFMATRHSLTPDLVKVENGKDATGQSALAIRVKGLTRASGSVEVLTQTFTPPEIVKMKTYDLMASPLVYPGQTVQALIRADKSNSNSVDVRLRLKVYSKGDELVTGDAPAVLTLAPGNADILKWTIPDTMDSQPIQQLGLALSVPSGHLNGTVWLDYLRWDSTPELTLRRPLNGPSDFWRQAWVNGVSEIKRWNQGPAFYVAQNDGEGIISYGTREWRNYTVTVSNFRVNLGAPSGVAVRVQGLRRWYALLFTSGGRIAFVKSIDRSKVELASAEFKWELDRSYEVAVTVVDTTLKAQIDGKGVLEASDDRFSHGGIGFVVTNGSVSAEEVRISPQK